MKPVKAMKTQQYVYIETYGCQMNEADTEIVLSILSDAGYRQTDNMANADVLLINTCAVRENAEQRVIGRMSEFSHQKKINSSTIIGVLGCMAEKVRRELLATENFIDLVVGPDEYRKLPSLIELAKEGEKGIAVKLSEVEKYEDIKPLRTDGLSAWISIMRGCDKFCSFCVVPFTRGRERSRSLSGIVKEVEELSNRGFKEITLLGQNVNSYKDGKYDFSDLLRAVADVDKMIRIRFTTSHPQDMSDKLIEAIAERENICNYIHLPVQSGSNRILKLMNRNYTTEHYLKLIQKIRKAIPEVCLSTDIIAGFPTETEEDHNQTIELIKNAGFDGAFTFKYSPRKNTESYKLVDNVSEEVKIRRLNEIIELQRSISLKRNEALVGRKVKVLIEGLSKKSIADYCGRTDTNKMVVFPKNGDVVGEYIDIQIEKVNSATLFGVHVIN